MAIIEMNPVSKPPSEWHKELRAVAYTGWFTHEPHKEKMDGYWWQKIFKYLVETNKIAFNQTAMTARLTPEGEMALQEYDKQLYQSHRPRTSR
ncbi:MAG: hypothetical protein HXX08_11540 [Chloroflexi bacterium]|uniref:Uncharacterized protein n=1 Tax=Candidatus Chlorohelix allophototropha TaxID=3003348 RepID=A0A8T7LZH6_9CHLR|nr:hypothetical protein [Chloroflexota bacterium]WJW65871.1 hypothetical protein OZ401_001650 [Chloroflexota bacterium L227-S17]